MQQRLHIGSDTKALRISAENIPENSVCLQGKTFGVYAKLYKELFIFPYEKYYSFHPSRLSFYTTLLFIILTRLEHPIERVYAKMKNSSKNLSWIQP
jgi:hypothetical protein